MASAAGSGLTAFIPTLVLLALQEVSNFVAGTARSVLSAFTPTLLLLA